MILNNSSERSTSGENNILRQMHSDTNVSETAVKNHQRKRYPGKRCELKSIKKDMFLCRREQ